MGCVNLTHCIFGELRSPVRQLQIGNEMRACVETVRLAVWADTTRPDSMGQERGLSRKATFKAFSTYMEADDRADSM